MSISVNYNGKSQASGATSSAAVAMPVANSATKLSFVRVVATNPAYIRFGASDVAAASDVDMLVTQTPTIIFVRGKTHFRVIRESADGVVNITPVTLMK